MGLLLGKLHARNRQPARNAEICLAAHTLTEFLARRYSVCYWKWTNRVDG
jgi:hypothetical protein